MLPNLHTPLVLADSLFDGRPAYFKCEHLQPSGCFKIRGAAHLLTELAKRGPVPALVVPSMGNTAIAAALGARAYGTNMMGVVPRAIGAAKEQKLIALGADLVKVDGGGAELLATARRLADEQGAYFVHPHLDPLWTDGYGVILDQILKDLPDVRSLVIPVGGGGLLMGLSAALQQRPNAPRLYGVEAYNAPTYAAYSHPRGPTAADGLLLDVPHPVVQARIASSQIEIGLVREDDLRQALRGLYDRFGLYVEPSSAVVAAFIRASLGRLPEPIAAVLTGANIAEDAYYRLLAG